MELFNTAVTLARSGFGSPAASLGVIQATMGMFFACSGYNKLFDRARHAGLVETFKHDHVPAVRFNQWWVPGWELTGGLMLLTGVFPAFAAAVLSIICLVACMAEGRERVEGYHPINRADRVADWLYLQEVLYIIALLAVVFGGGYATL